MKPIGFAFLYELIEASLADTRRLFQYSLENEGDRQFTLKRFGYSWLLSTHKWKRGDRVLDVGAGYSLLPSQIAEKHACDVWAVDDFGTRSKELFWTRKRDPKDFIRSQSSVTYVLERLGDPDASSLEADSFDVIYSVSALEHVPDKEMESVWKHMDRLLRVDGEMFHTIDLKFQADRGLRYLMGAEILDLIYPLLPVSVQARYVRATPRCYFRSVKRILNVQGHTELSRLSSIRMAVDPEVLTDPPEITYNRIVKDGMDQIRHKRNAALAIRLKKVG